jgi:hypothetical protein
LKRSGVGTIARESDISLGAEEIRFLAKLELRDREPRFFEAEVYGR